MAKKDDTLVLLAAGVGSLYLYSKLGKAQAVTDDEEKPSQIDYTKHSDDELRVECLSQGDTLACRELRTRDKGYDQSSPEHIEMFKNHTNGELEQLCNEGGVIDACDELFRRQHAGIRVRCCLLPVVQPDVTAQQEADDPTFEFQTVKEAYGDVSDEELKRLGEQGDTTATQVLFKRQAEAERAAFQRGEKPEGLAAIFAGIGSFFG